MLGSMAYDGTVCGIDNDDLARAVSYWPHPQTSDFKMCAKSCDETAVMATTYPANYWMQQYTPDPNNLPIIPYTSKVKYGFCFPDIVTSGMSSQQDSADEAKMLVNTYIADLMEGLWVIGVSAVIGLLMSFVYLQFVKKCAGCLIWGTLAITLVCGFLIGYFLMMDGMAKGKDGEIEVYVGYGFLGVTGIWFLILIFLRNRIRIAVQVMKSATRAIQDMPFMVLMPIPLTLCGVSFFIVWTLSMLYITSVGKFIDISTPAVLRGVTVNGDLVGDTYKYFTFDDSMNDTIWANVFFMFWVLNFIIYFLYLTIAGAVADWYFTRRDADGNKIRGNEPTELTKAPLTAALCRTARYHLGTIAFASLIIAAIQTLRAFVAYMEKTMGEKKTKLQKIMFKILHCCLWCAEKCMDKISRNALIFTAIYGHALCPAAFSSFKLIWRNLARTAAISMVSGFIGMLGKLCIVLFTCAICVLLLSEATDVNFIFTPIVVIFFISYMVAALFMNLLGIVVDVVFLCFLVDEEANKDKGEMYADEGLRTIVQSNEAASKKIAARSKANRTQVAPVEV